MPTLRLQCTGRRLPVNDGQPATRVIAVNGRNSRGSTSRTRS